MRRRGACVLVLLCLAASCSRDAPRRTTSTERPTSATATATSALPADPAPEARGPSTPPAPRAAPVPVTGHPRLWLTDQDLPRLRAWMSGPLGKALSSLAAEAKQSMDEGNVPGRDSGIRTYSEFPTEMYAEVFAFMSLMGPDTQRDDFARRARTLLMHAIGEAAKPMAEDAPFRDPAFSTSDRSRWHGEAWALTVDWIYGRLSAADKASIRRVFLRWVDENVHATTTSNNHPEPVGVLNDPRLVADRKLVRFAGNNYYTAHMRNIGLMALSFDAGDDPGNQLRGALTNATGAWLYVVDNLLRTDARGGLAPEGFEYSPQAVGYVAQLLYALHTAGADDPAKLGPQVDVDQNPFWSDFPVALGHSISPVPVDSNEGPVYLPAWYGDGQNYRSPDFIEALGPLGLYHRAREDRRALNAIRWIQINGPPGGAEGLTDRVGDANNFRDAILYFLLLEPGAPAPADPRPATGFSFFAPGVGKLLARTGWGRDASWFTYTLGWMSVDHQHADGNRIELWRKGEWLTKERTGYGWNIGSSDYKNTLALQNDVPEHNDSGDHRHVMYVRGSQWMGEPSGDGRILAKSVTAEYAYASGDATALYNSDYEGVRDITHASRSVVWVKPDHVIVYDRAASKTSGRFKRFWLNLAQAPAISGNRAVARTPNGQQLSVTTLLPTDAQVSGERAEALEEEGEPADGDTMQFRLRVEAPGGPTDTRFLHVLQGADASAAPDQASVVGSTAGTRFVGARAGRFVVMFRESLDTAFAGTTFVSPAGAARCLVTGLDPAATYQVTTRAVAGGVEVSVAPGGSRRTDDGGVLTIDVS